MIFLRYWADKLRDIRDVLMDKPTRYERELLVAYRGALRTDAEMAELRVKIQQLNSEKEEMQKDLKRMYQVLGWSSSIHPARYRS